MDGDWDEVRPLEAGIVSPAVPFRASDALTPVTEPNLSPLSISG